MKKSLDSLSSAKPTSTPTVEEVKPHAAEDVKPAEAPFTTTAAAPAAPASTEAAPAAVITPTPTESTPAADTFETLFPEPRVALGAPPSWLWWVLLLIISVVLGVVGYALTQRNLKTWLSTEATPIPSASPSETPSSTPTETPSATPTPTAEATPTATPTPTGSTVQASSVTLRVLNGTTTTGAAGKTKTILENADFTVRTTGNAKNQDYATTIVYYQAGRLAEAQLVQKALTGYSVSLEESTLAAPDMVLVVVGKK